MTTDLISAQFNHAKQTLEAFSTAENMQKIVSGIEIMYTALSKGNKIMSCGNGGSMCDAMHFAEELTGRFRKERSPLGAIAIADPSHITCVANDYGFEHIFSRYIEASGKAGDVLLAISTSGNSPNVINAVRSARAQGMRVIGLLGKDGGALKTMVDIPIVVGSNISDRIQEVHIKCIHIMIEGIERSLFPQNY